MTVFLLVFLFLTVLSRVPKDMVSRRLLFFYLAYWGIALFLCETGAYDIEVSQSTMFLVYGHLIAFVLGFLVLNNTIKGGIHVFNQEKFKHQVDNFLKNPFIWGIIIVTTLYYISLYATFFIRIQVLASAGDARAEFYAGELYGPIFYYLNPLIFIPLNYVTQAVMAYRATYRRDYIFWVLVVNNFVFASLSGGRLEYFRIAAVFLCVLYCIFDLIKNKKKLALYGAVAAFALFAMTTITSALRFGYTELNSAAWDAGVEVTEKHLQTYTAGPIAAFDYSIENHYVDKIGGYQYGKLTINSIIRFAASPGRIIGLDIKDPVKKITPLKQEETIAFGDVASFNALYTSLFIYYLDFGVFGVFIIPFILGILYRWIIRLLIQYQSLPLLILVCWMFYATLRSVMDYPFFTPTDIPMILLLLYLGTSKQKKLTV